MGDKNIRTLLLLPNINTLSRHFHSSYLPRAPVHVFSNTQQQIKKLIPIVIVEALILET